MSNLEVAPAELACAGSQHPDAPPVVQVLHPREVPLGGPRAIRVQRTMPQRQRSLVGAWCFHRPLRPGGRADGRTAAPHTGLQTVSWLLSGEVEHRDSAGVRAAVRPGELNLMTAGAGICHSEVSVDSRAPLHGVQRWVALPASARDTGRDFAHYTPVAMALPGAQARVFLGELAGSRSPVRTFTPLLGTQIDIEAGRTLDIDVDPAFEHGVLCDVGIVTVDGGGPDERQIGVPRSRAGAAASAQLRGGARAGAAARRSAVRRRAGDVVKLRRTKPRGHRRYRRLWEDADDRFGAVRGYRGSVTRLPAPPLPTVRLRPRPVPQRKGNIDDNR